LKRRISEIFDLDVSSKSVNDSINVALKALIDKGRLTLLTGKGASGSVGITLWGEIERFGYRIKESITIERISRNVVNAAPQSTQQAPTKRPATTSRKEAAAKSKLAGNKKK